MTSFHVLNFDEPWKKYDVIYLSIITEENERAKEITSTKRKEPKKSSMLI